MVVSLLEEDLEKYVLANIYTLNTKDKRTFDNALKNIKESSVLNDEEKFYYTNSINCIISFHTCKKTFQEYINNNPELKTQKIKNSKKQKDGRRENRLFFCFSESKNT